MDIFKDRRVIALGGAALALVAGLVIAFEVAMHQSDDEEQAAPASEGGLLVQTGREDDLKLTPGRALRCFVGGKLVGEMPIAECANKNGVATGAMDVGLDASGSLAAGAASSVDLTPLPPPAPEATRAQANPAAEESVTEADVSGAAEALACWRYGGGGWRRETAAMSLNACVQTLYAGHCAAPGTAAYGRWGDHTLRLVAGRVETSVDNASFRPLVQQQKGCAIPAVG
ncbi:MAG TPA: hypothetical protein VG166_02510 [Caulobacteraceae bacterium]|jgi:hypothetical protein|nr:hypothetical protein [Caulobacteraceae bacterium]